MKKQNTLTGDDLLRLDIQFFAEDDTKDESITETDDVDPKEDLTDDKTDEEKAFTQAEVDRIVKDRLARERKKQKEEEELKQAEEQGKYKELYEKTQEQLAEITRKSILESALLKAGYTEDQIERYSKYVEGEDESEINESVQELVKDITPGNSKEQLGDDPSPYPAQRKTPAPKDGLEYGKQAYERIRKLKK